jgi:DNA-binding NarL/FixJ family response regulator
MTAQVFRCSGIIFHHQESSGVRVLIIDPEYLVAMEAERILGEAVQCEVEIAMPHNYPLVLEKAGFSVIVIDALLLGDGQGEAAKRLRAADAALVLTTLDDGLDGIAGFEGVPVVSKPFIEEQLAEAVRNAAGRS